MRKTYGILITAAAAVLVLSLAAYYVFIILEARDYTRNVIAKDLESGSWRRPNGPANDFRLDGLENGSACHSL